MNERYTIKVDIGDIMDESDVYSEEHELSVHLVGVIRETLNNSVDLRDVIRELLSNSCSWQVGATKVGIAVYGPDKDGFLCINVEDNGCGMNYTRDNKNPGRLDKFLNIAYSEQAGIQTDEFGSKGLGTILLHNSRFVEIETSTGGDSYYRIIFDDPLGSLEKGNYKKPEVQTFKTPRRSGKGTSVTVKGYADLKDFPSEFDFDDLLRYLRYLTVIGYTLHRSLPLPQINLRVGSKDKIVKTGFPYIDNPADERTMIFGPKEFTNSDGNKNVKILVNGGITIETSKYDLNDNTGGIYISYRGIPYFRLDGRHSAYRNLSLTADFVRIIVNCDDVPLNTARSNFNYADVRLDLFEDALAEAIDWIKNLPEFKKFLDASRYDKVIQLQEYMSEMKKLYSESKIEYVWFNGKRILAKPESEYEVAAILWKLESIPGGLPFKKFETISYPGKRKGIDMLINFQEDNISEDKLFIYCELERKFSGFFDHRHEPKQASVLMCWALDSRKNYPGKIHPTTIPWKHIYVDESTSIPIYVMSKFPNIEIAYKSSHEEKK